MKINLSLIYKIPDGILLKVFKFLNPKSIVTCSAVCRKWQDIVYFITIDECLWRKFCEKDYSDVCHSAFETSIGNLSWYQLYKSLTLWTKLSCSQETIKEITVSNRQIGFRGCQVLRDGNIGILTVQRIVNCDIDTLLIENKSYIKNDNNEYLMYSETDDTILVLNKSNQLLIGTIEREHLLKTKTYMTHVSRWHMYNDVYIFMQLENIIYYVTNSNSIFECNLKNGINTFLVQMPNKVLFLGHRNGILHFMTIGFIIYSCTSKKLTRVLIYNFEEDEFDIIKHYNLINQKLSGMEYARGWFRDTFYFKTLAPQKRPTLIHTHGPVIFAAYYNCVLRIFHSKYVMSVIDSLKCKPLKVYNFMNLNEDIGSLILKIDVVEGKESHIVIVAMPQRVVFIKFTHSFKNDEEQSSSIEESVNIDHILSAYQELSINNRKKSSRKQCHIM